MWNDHWNGSIDGGNNTVTIRCPDDGLETMAITIGWALNYGDVNSAQSEYSNATKRAELKIVQDEAAQSEWDKAHYRDLLHYNVPVPKQSAEVPRVVLYRNTSHRVELGPDEIKLVSLTAIQRGSSLNNCDLIWAPENDEPFDTQLVDGVEIVTHNAPGMGVML